METQDRLNRTRTQLADLRERIAKAEDAWTGADAEALGDEDVQATYHDAVGDALERMMEDEVDLQDRICELEAQVASERTADLFPEEVATWLPGYEPQEPAKVSPTVVPPTEEPIAHRVFGEPHSGEVLLNDRFAEIRRVDGKFRAIVYRNGHRQTKTCATIGSAIAFLVDEPAKVIALAEPVKPGTWTVYGFACSEGFADVRHRRDAMPVRANATEPGRRHRDSILSLANGPVRSTCNKVARILPSATGSFTVAVEVDALESREKFRRDLRAAKGSGSYVRGSHSKAGNTGSPISTMRDGFEPAKVESRTAITEPGSVIATVDGPWSELPTSDGRVSYRVDEEGTRIAVGPTPIASDRGRTVGYMVEEGKVEPKRSLRVDVPNDCADDVFAEVVADIAGLKGRAIPCANCSRRFPFRSFVEEVAKHDLTREQRAILRDLVSAFRSGMITDACPTLWYTVGMKPPFVEEESDEEGNPTNTEEVYCAPYGVRADSVTARHGTRKGEEVFLRCRMRSLAKKYAYRAALRFAYASAKFGNFADARQDTDGEEIADWSATDLAFDEEFAFAGSGFADREYVEYRSPEEVICERAERSEYVEKVVANLRATCRTVSRGARLEKVLRIVADGRSWPTGSEVAQVLGVPERTARQDLIDLKTFVAGMGGV